LYLTSPYFHLTSTSSSQLTHHPHPQYTPTASDLVIATIHHTSLETYHASLTPHGALATLPQMAFEGATKKTRPQLQPGDVVYARVAAASRHTDAELACVGVASGRAEGLGPLVGGMVVDVGLGFARRLLMAPASSSSSAAGSAGSALQGSTGKSGKGRNTTPTAAAGEQNKSGIVVLDELGGAGLAFETAVGRNGRVWVNSESAATVVAVCRALAETAEKGLDVEGQRKLVQRLRRGG
jgi:exosome complex component RRP40